MTKTCFRQLKPPSSLVTWILTEKGNHSSNWTVFKTLIDWWSHGVILFEIGIITIHEINGNPINYMGSYMVIVFLGIITSMGLSWGYTWWNMGLSQSNFLRTSYKNQPVSKTWQGEEALSAVDESLVRSTGWANGWSTCHRKCDDPWSMAMFLFLEAMLNKLGIAI